MCKRQNESLPCAKCNKNLAKNNRIIKCFKCLSYYHVKCSQINHKTFYEMEKKDNNWCCEFCLKDIQPFFYLDTNELISMFINKSLGSSVPKPQKCGSCSKRIPKHLQLINCTDCKKYFHVKCVDINRKEFKSSMSWKCSHCLSRVLPFCRLNDDEFYLELHGIISERLKSIPSFSIQSLIDLLPGQTFDVNEFLNENTSSNYFTPAQFKSGKFSNSGFAMIHINIASLSKHIDELKCFLSLLDFPYDVIAVTESRLQSNSPIANLEIEGYDFIHTPTQTQCGGTGLYIKSSHDFEVIESLTKSNFNISESIFVELKHKSCKNLIVGCIYRHHTPIETFLEEYFLETLEHISNESNKNCALLGDFNVNLLNYGIHNSTDQFYDTISSFGFRPLILQPTRVTSKTATLIDNIFINDITCKSVGGNITSSISDHFFQFCQIDCFNKPKNKKYVKYARSYRNFNQHEFGEELKQINWENLFSTNNNIQSLCSQFLEKIEKLLDEMAPVRKMTKKDLGLEQRPWITKGILISMKKRDQYYKVFAHNRDVEIQKMYKLYRNMIITLTRRSKQNYYANFFTENQTNIKKTWDGIRNIINISKGKSTNFRKLVSNGKVIKGNREMANAMNTFFTNIGTSVEAKVPTTDKRFSSYLKHRNDNSIVLRECDATEIASIIKEMKSSKSCGPFSIPTGILKTFSSILINPIVFLMNKSLEDGIFPDFMKIASVCPIFKKNDKTRCENYRPISLLSNLSKIFERVMYVRVANFLEKYDTFYKLQFGFRKRYSTNHALLSIVENIRNNLDNKLYTCGVFVDLEKAFDTVNHKILVYKLDYYGIRGQANSWFKSYLTNRYQSVTLNGETSEKLPIGCGVPQGSILGPLLFLIYINDMNLAFKHALVHHFADDTNLLYSDKDPKRLKKIMNSELKLLFDWLCANRLSLNVNKTEFIIFRPPRKTLNYRFVLKLNNTSIYESHKIKYLGILLDDRLSWKVHLSELSKKLSRSVGMLYRLRHFCPNTVLRSLYFSLFNSHLSYGLPIWGNADRINIEKIKILQKRAVRAITFSSSLISSETIFKSLEILKLDDMLRFQISALMWDYDHNTLPTALTCYFKEINLIHHYQTRSSYHGKLTTNKFNTDRYGKNSFQNQGSKTLNEIKTMNIYKDANSKSSFLNQYKKIIFENYI